MQPNAASANDDQRGYKKLEENDLEAMAYTSQRETLERLGRLESCMTATNKVITFYSWTGIVFLCVGGTIGFFINTEHDRKIGSLMFMTAFLLLIVTCVNPMTRNLTVYFLRKHKTELIQVLRWIGVLLFWASIVTAGSLLYAKHLQML